MSRKQLTRQQLLAAEIFGYSYAHYLNSTGIGKIRFDRLMPQDVEKLERAVVENWALSRVAKEMGVDTDAAASLIQRTKRAIEVVDAENPAETFRNAVRQVIRQACHDGLGDDESIEQLVEQVCYRAADLAYLLERDGDKLSRYSKDLRR